ncbi:MAG TPA: MoaD/ThiS family protein [Clostridiaceae bacterium]|nr:MoaD/ThiS family protein [Clostridiaceae bacterium]
MNVEVRLFATFREGREKKYILELPQESNILTVLDMLKIKEEDVSILLLNGRDGDVSRLLKDGDILALFPPVGGG